MVLLISVQYCVFIILFPLIIYLIFSRKFNIASLNLEVLKNIIMYYVIRSDLKRYKQKYQQILQEVGDEFETEINIPTQKHFESQHFYGVDQDGNSLLLNMSLSKDAVASVYLHLRIQDNVYVLPSQNAILDTSLPKNRWKAEGFNIEIVAPFKKLRITFNGLLKNIAVKKDPVEHVQFNFIFIACCSPYYFPQDIDDAVLGSFLLKEKFKKVRNGLHRNNTNDQFGLTQFGVLNGFVRNKSCDETTLNLQACRTKCKGIDDKYVHNRVFNIVAADECGNIFNIGLKQFEDGGTSKLVYGFAYLSSSDKRFLVTSIKIKGDAFEKNNSFPDSTKIETKVNGKVYKLNIFVSKSQIHKAVSNYKNGYQCFSTAAKCDINTNKARAVLTDWYQYEGSTDFIPELKLREKTVELLPELLISDIAEEESQILDLTGGKGCSLALLVSLKSSEFTVPDGFIITVNAYKGYVRENISLIDSISLLNDICCGKEYGKLEEACKRTVECFKNQQISENLKEALILQLRKYQLEKDSPGWAVRSSAIGEDSEEFSAAGQNETFLGCQSQEQILQSIQACWASLYTYQSVQYRWQHGLPVITNMAVVVQKMVKSESAGVLFTCHPSTCNPSQMVITSNFGLGETVVSGEADPDTYVLNRTYNNQIQISTRTLGTKNKVLKVTESGLQESTEQNNLEQSSLTDNLAIQLGKVGVLLESAFGNPRDIEWGFYKGKLYLFQSRPITTLTTWTDFELSHEMDDPILTKCAAFTTANIREVVPKAASVLTRTSSLRCLDWSVQKSIRQNFDPASSKAITTYQHNVFLDVIKGIHMQVNPEVEVSSTTIDLAIFGHPVLDKKLNDMCIKRSGVSTGSAKLKQFLHTVRYAWENHKTMSLAQDAVKKLDFEGKSPETLYDKINAALYDIEAICIYHSKATGTSVFYQILTMNVLLEGKQNITEEHMSDFSAILSSCEDVISAEVPKYLEGIATILKEEGLTDKFRKVDPTDGVSWLKSNCLKAYDLYREFLDKHGHRGWGEFEVMDDSWNDQPSKIISIVQANSGIEKKEKVKMDVDDVIRSLKSSNRVITKAIVKFFLKKIRSSVGIREHTKSALVLSIDKLRKAYRHLGQEMVLNGMLPTKDLIYHLTHEEVGSIIKCRNPLLISKAMRRQKLYTTWKKMKFPEIMLGIPTPESDEDVEITNLKEVIKGTPVCRGTVQARACVIRSLDEISQLKSGDILITYSTDIGWSPYFPMLSGVVTELGGLVSHGAVVAREYGLPCVVGTKNVLKYFTTGDIVYLNGDTGELGKV